MQSYPNRCQHIKVNGTQCGSPALRRNPFCYFHKRHHEEQIELNLDRGKTTRGRRRKAALALPVLEDANSIQVSLMQIMRLIVSGQLDTKAAGLLLYALQTASVNLARTNFEPHRNNVILDPAAVAEIPLGAQAWEDSDFEDDNDEEEDDDEDDDEENDEPENIRALKAKYGPVAAALNPVVRSNEPPARQTSAKSENAPAPKVPPSSAKQVREQIGEMIRQAVPELRQSVRENESRGG